MNPEDLIKDAIDSAPKFDEVKLKRLADLAREVDYLEARNANLEQDIKDNKKRILALVSKDIPDVMRSAGVSCFELTDGTSVEITKSYSAGIAEKREAEAHEWLRSHGYGDLIKNRITLDFGKGEDDKAEAVKAALKALPEAPGFESKESVNATSLKAFVREKYEQGQGDSLPDKLLGIFVMDLAKITKPKTRKNQEK